MTTVGELSTKDIFEDLDVDEDGQICHEDLYVVMACISQTQSDDQFTETINKLLH